MIDEVVATLRQWPPWLGFAGLWGFAVLRGFGWYGVGRLGRRAGEHPRLAHLLEHRRFVQAQDSVHRFGTVAVAASYLIFGVLAAVNAAAGLTRMSMRSYLPGVAIGSTWWASWWFVVGALVLRAIHERDPRILLWIVPVAVLGTLVVTYVRRSRMSEETEAGGSSDAPEVETKGV